MSNPELTWGREPELDGRILQRSGNAGLPPMPSKRKMKLSRSQDGKRRASFTRMFGWTNYLRFTGPAEFE
jgi:hypothetical protein